MNIKQDETGKERERASVWRLIKRSHWDICWFKCSAQRQLGESKVTQVLLLIITWVADTRCTCMHSSYAAQMQPAWSSERKKERAMSSIEHHIKSFDVSTGKWSKGLSHAHIGLKYSVSFENAINCTTMTWGYFSQMRESTASEEALFHLHIFSSLAGRVTISPRTL